MSEPRPEIDEQTWDEAFDWVMVLDRNVGDAAVATRFHAWLAQRPDRAEAYDQVRKVWTAAPRMRPTLAANLVPLAAKQARSSRRRWLRWAVAGGAAAGVALTVGGGWRHLRSDHATATGEIRAAALPDGSRMQLDTDSAVRVSYGAAMRQVTLLRGRAFFEVTRDAERPFTVDAGPVRVEVIGTRFAVCLDDGVVSVAVEEGQVAIASHGRIAFRREALTRGEAVRIDLQTGIGRYSAVSPDAIAAWRHGQLVVEDWTVAQVLDELGRYHRGAILLRDEALGAKRVSGYYDLRRPVEAVRAVAQSQGGQVRELGPWLLLVSAR